MGFGRLIDLSSPNTDRKQQPSLILMIMMMAMIIMMAISMFSWKIKGAVLWKGLLDIKLIIYHLRHPRSGKVK